MKIQEDNKGSLGGLKLRDEGNRLEIAKSAFGIGGDEYYIDQLVKACQFQMEAIIDRNNRSCYWIRFETAARELNTLAKNITIITTELQATKSSRQDD
ncbi:hypothetical protein [Mesorhizobium sp. CA7]|uniref:hypothetical protein n=1 Tax=Mesorhizobium sp. CA7 TaxID=588501 RepID=UPI001CCCF2D4|nr:hypothetical protein [Mesorhizobium sp. CA7]MBZ9812479.1 hypothetical protein [Mesorhizobium sp. CA7]